MATAWMLNLNNVEYTLEDREARTRLTTAETTISDHSRALQLKQDLLDFSEDFVYNDETGELALANPVIIDDELDLTSTHLLQNNVITAAIEQIKQGEIVKVRQVPASPISSMVILYLGDTDAGFDYGSFYIFDGSTHEWVFVPVNPKTATTAEIDELFE